MGNESNSNDVLFFENSYEERIWDLVVVYEGINVPRFIKVKNGGLLFICGEPPMSRKYSNRFLKLFDSIIIPDSSINHRARIITHQALPWHYGFNHKTETFSCEFDELKRMPPPLKYKNISMISSAKTMMPGHKNRKLFMAHLMKKFDDKIDFYGLGHNWVEDKRSALDNYMFSICVENSNIPDYWTEKISDAYLAYTVPIYFGCTNIDKYFDPKSYIYIDITDVEVASKTISSILENPQIIYESYFDALCVSREKVLSEYNLFGLIKKLLKTNIVLLDTYQALTLIPSNSFFDHHVKNNLLRIKRGFYKILSK